MGMASDDDCIQGDVPCVERSQYVLLPNAVCDAVVVGDNQNSATSKIAGVLCSEVLRGGLNPRKDSSSRTNGRLMACLVDCCGDVVCTTGERLLDPTFAAKDQDGHPVG